MLLLAQFLVSCHNTHWHCREKSGGPGYKECSPANSLLHNTKKRFVKNAVNRHNVIVSVILRNSAVCSKSEYLTIYRYWNKLRRFHLSDIEHLPFYPNFKPINIVVSHCIDSTLSLFYAWFYCFTYVLRWIGTNFCQVIFITLGSDPHPLKSDNHFFGN